MIDGDDANIFTADNLRLIAELERRLHDETDYPRYCATEFSRCIPPQSVIRFFDGSMNRTSGSDSILYDPNFENIGPVLIAGVEMFDSLTVDTFLGSHYRVLNDTITNNGTVVWMPLGLPLAGFDSGYAQVREQEELLVDFLLRDFRPIMDPLFRNGLGEMRVTYYAEIIDRFYIEEAAYDDVLYLSLGFFFMGAFIAFTTQSLFLAFFLLLLYANSVSVANLFYRYVFHFDYFSFFHLISPFIIIGVASVEAFIVCDAWRETTWYKFRSAAQRLSFCVRRVTIAPLIVATVAFGVASKSPIKIVKTFNVFSAILFVTSYFSIIVFLPSAILIYAKYYERYICLWFCPKKNYIEQRYVNAPTGAPAPAEKASKSVLRTTSVVRSELVPICEEGQHVKSTGCETDCEQSNWVATHSMPGDYNQASEPPIRRSPQNNCSDQSHIVEKNIAAHNANFDREVRETETVKAASTEHIETECAPTECAQIERTQTECAPPEYAQIERTQTDHTLAQVNQTEPEQTPVTQRSVMRTEVIQSDRLKPNWPSAGRQKDDDGAISLCTARLNSSLFVQQQQQPLPSQAGSATNSRGSLSQHLRPAAIKASVRLVLTQMLEGRAADPDDVLHRIPERNLLARILLEEYFELITHRLGRWIAVGAFLALTVFFMIQISSLQLDNSNVCSYCLIFITQL